LIEFATGKPRVELPPTFALANGAQLTRRIKGDVFYVTTPTACSCPARACKHMRALLSGNSREDSRAKGGSMDSIRPGKDESWAGGHNGPVSEVV